MLHSYPKPKTLFLNARRLDYDAALDFTRLRSLTTFHAHPVDSTSTAEIAALLDLHQPEILITKELSFSPELMSTMPSSLKLFCEAGTGFNNLPTAALRALGIAVTNVPHYSTDAVAAIAITFIMNFSASMFEQQAMLSRGDRRNFTSSFALPLTELSGKTIGLVGGGGRIGSRVADIALALGMRVMISSRRGCLGPEHRHGGRVEVTSDVGRLLAEADYVSLHLPLSAETQGSFGRAQIETMKHSAWLVNTSRGGVIDETELIECLKEGRIRGAGLDVTADEPLADDSPLWKLKNVWLTPHIGWRRVETRQRLVDMTAINIEAYVSADGDEARMVNVVN